MTLTRNPTAMMASWNAPRSLTFETYRERAFQALLDRLYGEKPWRLDGLNEHEIRESPWHGANGRLNGQLLSLPEDGSTTAVRTWIRKAIVLIETWPAQAAADLVPLFPEIFPREYEGCHVSAEFDTESGHWMLRLDPQRPADRPWVWADGLGKLRQLGPHHPLKGWSPATPQTQDQIRGAVYERRLGGDGTDYVTYDLTIAYDESRDPRKPWVPVHGNVRMDACVTVEAAAAALQSYWDCLPDEKKMSREGYARRYGDATYESSDGVAPRERPAA